MKKRDEELMKMCGYSGADVPKFNKSAETMKKDAFKESKENQALIKRAAPKLVKEGRLACAIDYKAIKNQKGDEEPDALGVSLIMTLEDFQRYSYLIDYLPSFEKDKETTVALARRTLEEYGLWEFVESGKIPFVADAGLVSAVKLLAPNCMVEICNFHTVGRTITNTLTTNLHEYDPRAKTKTENMNKFIRFCRDGFSKNDLASLPQGTAKSINNWTLSHVLTEEDRLNMGKYISPKGWKEKWNEINVENEEIEPRNTFLQKFTKIPVVKVPKNIRPRTTKPALDFLMIMKPHLLAAKDDESHPLHEHSQNLPDFEFIEAQQKVCALLEPFIDFYERDDNQQMGEFFAVVNHLSKWAGSPQGDNSRLSRQLQNHKERF